MNEQRRKEIIRVEDNYYILAKSALADDRTRVLKQGETFALFDRYGDIQPVGMGEQGLYHEGTRYLNRLELHLEGERPLLLSSMVNADNSILSVDLANQDIMSDGNLLIPRDTIQFVRFKFLWKSVCYEHFWIRSFALRPVDITFSLTFDADFRDIFEIRGLSRKQRGRFLDPVIDDSSVCLGYEGLDGIVRRTRLESTPAPREISSSELIFSCNVQPRGEANIYVTITCETDACESHPVAYSQALAKAQKELDVPQELECTITASSQLFNEWISRSKADLQMMITNTPQGPYPYAGVPWFSTPFGRDGIITAMQVLWMRPGLARGVLQFLAAHQASEIDDERDAEPGKIIHEMRSGEMAALREIPFGLYYGSIDSTPLFIMLAGMYYRRTGDREFIQTIWPNIVRALEWIDKYGDIDHDGFVEYRRHSSEGLVHQGWKDSHDSVFHSDGSDAVAPIALCEVQAYVYAAKLGASEMAQALGKSRVATELAAHAKSLRDKFEAAFWIEELGTYALALDGQKRPCKVKTSNAGHCLFGGIANRRNARLTAQSLLDKSSFSGWGVRTVADTELRYNPMSYHNGSVWPHDNSMIAYGLSQYGLKAQVLQILKGMFDAGNVIDLHRMPELFCGFMRRKGIGPTFYPLACSPQSWAAGSVFMLLQSALGLSIDAPHGSIYFHRPALPEFLHEIELKNLSVGKGSVDLILRRDGEDVSLNVTRRKGNLAVVLIK